MPHQHPAYQTHATTSLSGAAAASVLRNTYMLLGICLAFSTGASMLAMSMNIGFVNPWIVLGVYFVLLFATSRLATSAWGLLSVLGLTSWLGFTTGPIINMYSSVPGGMDIVTTALGGTAGIFFAMSAIALISKKDFSFMGNFLMVGILVAFFAGIVGYIFELSTLQLVVSSMFVFLSSMLILYETSQIVHGGQTNYILATVTIFVSLYNLFMSLLHLLTAMGGDD